VGAPRIVQEQLRIILKTVDLLVYACGTPDGPWLVMQPKAYPMAKLANGIVQNLGIS